jgi:hypothetical protein
LIFFVGYIDVVTSGEKKLKNNKLRNRKKRKKKREVFWSNFFFKTRSGK